MFVYFILGEKDIEHNDEERERDPCKTVKGPQFAPAPESQHYEAYQGNAVNVSRPFSGHEQ